jgi:hypothetical protein
VQLRDRRSGDALAVPGGAATIDHHMGVPLDTTYLEPTGRPRYVVENGKPIGELL